MTAVSIFDLSAVRFFSAVYDRRIRSVSASMAPLYNGRF